MNEKIELVEERIWIVKKLIESKNIYAGIEYVKDMEPNGWDHPYKHYSALRNYLLFTCFDILGQPSEWVDFNTWLVSRRKKNEREKVLSGVDSTDILEVMKFVNLEYTKIYGVKNSFFRFIREVLSETNRKKLYSSIQVSKIFRESVNNPDGSVTSGLLTNVDVEIERKEKLLFLIRNSFTHKGESLSSGSAGLFEGHDEKKVHIPGEKPGYLTQMIHIEKIKGVEHRFFSVGWPFILLEILEETIKQLKEI